VPVIHPHSAEAYHSELPRLSRRALKIIDWIELHPKVTDREVMLGMGFTDMNSVRPRITEAVDLGSLVEVAERRCPCTGKTVRVLDLSLDERGRRQDVRAEAA
jgi:hypothetical protein